MPAIKTEESPEPPMASIVPAVSSKFSARAFETDRKQPSSDARAAVGPSMPPPKPYLVAKQAHLAPSAYHGSSPRKYRLAALGNGSARVRIPKPPVLSRLPSRLGSAMATGRVNKTTLTATSTPRHHHKTPTLPNINRLTKHLAHKSNPVKMDENYIGFPPMMMNEADEETVIITRTELEDLQYHVELLQNAHAASEEKVQYQGELIMELVAFNQHTHNSLEDLNARVRNVESARTSRLHQQQSINPTSALAVQPAFGYRGADDTRSRSRSPSPDRRGYRDRNAMGSFKKGKGRKDLQIDIPGKTYAPPTAGLPTPMTHSGATLSARTPKTPLTPGRIGPPSGTKKSSTCINKRGIHNLDKMVPPTYAQLPLLPLTDTEIIVYFFNSLSRPIVSLRLYARKWGPAAICDAINTHREVEPGYLRNTCSVKCTTAIKKGRQLYGDDWDVVNRAIFENEQTTDDKATDMIRLGPDELEHASDFEVQSLCNGLLRHPGEGDGGIFTRCVKYCQENNAAYKLSDVWELASNLDAGRTPRRIHIPRQEQKTEDTSRAASESSDDSVIGGDTESSSLESY